MHEEEVVQALGRVIQAISGKLKLKAKRNVTLTHSSQEASWTPAKHRKTSMLSLP